MYNNKFKVVHFLSTMNPDMDYFILLDKETSSLTLAEMVIKKAERAWQDDVCGVGSSFVLSEYICYCLTENKFKVYGYFTNETQEDENTYYFVDYQKIARKEIDDVYCFRF